MTKEKKRGDDGIGVVWKGIVMLIVLGGVIVLVLWLVYRPEKPSFMVIGAAIYGLNVTKREMMSSSMNMQFSVVIKNPNRRLSIYYDRLSAFVSYRNHPITPQLLLPPLYHQKHTSLSLSPLIGATSIPLASFGLAVDQSYGVITLALIFEGRLRWKIGLIKTPHYPLYVKCDLFLGFNNGFVGQLPPLGVTPCHLHL